MSNIQFIVLIGSIFSAASFCTRGEGEELIPAIVGGVLFGVAIYLQWLS